MTKQDIEQLVVEAIAKRNASLIVVDRWFTGFMERNELDEIKQSRLMKEWLLELADESRHKDLKRALNRVL
ncbi:hypothetical protein [Aeromonas veronii]|uniref:hypothetical protein n=1 Tax=Aeromonas veronii TaxID=654 RepID=UPI003D1FB365